MTNQAPEKKSEPVPTWAYSADGEAKLFADKSEVPKGWKDSPAAFPKKESKQPE